MHCKDVSYRTVEFALDRETIEEKMRSWTAYRRAEYIVLNNGADHAVVSVTKESGPGLFQKVTDFEILSLPEDTDYVEDPNVDVLNIPTLAQIQLQHPGRAVVIKGMFSHVVFIKDIEPLYLEVVDNVPPSPSKLGVLVKMALASDYIDLPIVMHETVIDMADRTSEVKTQAVMFPCKVSGLTADMPVYYLDDSPELAHDVTLIGCHLSQRIFESLYRKEVPFVNVCPADFTEGKGKCIVKCCKVKNDHVIEGDVAKVPWGATVPEVVEAIKALFSDQ